MPATALCGSAIKSTALVLLKARGTLEKRSLDALTRIEMQQLIEDVWRARGFTAVLVTHDVAEAITLADRVILLEGGRVALDEFVDLPRPRTRGSARFACTRGAHFGAGAATQIYLATTRGDPCRTMIFLPIILRKEINLAHIWSTPAGATPQPKSFFIARCRP